MTRRLAEIARREAAVNRSLDAAEAQIAKADQARAEERAAYLKLQTDYAELTADYNHVVRESLQQSADLFRPRTPPPADEDGQCIPMPPRITRRGDAARQRACDVADPRGG
jgi:multidrug efflux pump subunit AcrA (membrane-fusion protein)